MFDLHLTEARSLKEKRMVLSRLQNRLRRRFNVSVAEVDHQDLWQRTALAVVCVGSARNPVDTTLRAVSDAVDRELPGEVLERSVDYVEADR